jgi:DNA-binding CsgD family transcriptional regulator
MSTDAPLTKRESQIAELIAWGAAKKEIASQLYISERTVENTARNIYAKTEVSKANELSAWWFCTNFNIPFDLSPLQRRMSFLLILLFAYPKRYMPIPGLDYFQNNSLVLAYITYGTALLLILLKNYQWTRYSKCLSPILLRK